VDLTPLYLQKTTYGGAPVGIASLLIPSCGTFRDRDGYYSCQPHVACRPLSPHPLCLSSRFSSLIIMWRPFRPSIGPNRTARVNHISITSKVRILVLRVSDQYNMLYNVRVPAQSLRVKYWMKLNICRLAFIINAIQSDARLSQLYIL
jgi:hypothetical protein